MGDRSVHCLNNEMLALVPVGEWGLTVRVPAPRVSPGYCMNPPPPAPSLMVPEQAREGAARRKEF